MSKIQILYTIRSIIFEPLLILSLSYKDILIIFINNLLKYGEAKSKLIIIDRLNKTVRFIPMTIFLRNFKKKKVKIAFKIMADFFFNN